MPKSMLGVGVIGLGFMGRTHVGAYEAARQAGYPCRLAALADSDASRLSGAAAAPGNLAGGSFVAVDSSSLKRYSNPAELLADPDVQIVSICTHTDTHVDLTLQTLAAGKHALVEKPLALRSADARRVVEAARGVAARCMPALCMRFWPGWSWVHEKITRGAFGRVRSAVFQRLGSAPAWAPDFYRDTARSGGALVDLHLHDADFVLWCFGRPAEVVSTGSVQHVTTLYRFEDGPQHVMSEGGWDHSPGFPFRMRFVVAFDSATAEFDSGRSDPLTLTQNGETKPVPLESITGWDLEIRHFVDAIAHQRGEFVAPIEAGVAVAELLEAEQRSLESRAPVGL